MDNSQQITLKNTIDEYKNNKSLIQTELINNTNTEDTVHDIIKLNNYRSGKIDVHDIVKEPLYTKFDSFYLKDGLNLSSVKLTNLNVVGPTEVIYAQEEANEDGKCGYGVGFCPKEKACHIDPLDGTGVCRDIFYKSNNPNPLRVCRDRCDSNCISTYFCFDGQNKCVGVVKL